MRKPKKAKKPKGKKENKSAKSLDEIVGAVLKIPRKKKNQNRK